ncbi:MAG TPA: zinc ABC transporter substrate-binding protein [Longimicrobiales bacterium]|nr:zinc ABC transporter substrate-binding protein [Longimicrobiales bacterium]
MRRRDRKGGAGRVVLLTLVAAQGAFAAACGRRSDAAPSNGVRAVATTSMIAWAVAEVGGTRVEVEGLMGPGVDPHLYKATASDVRKLAEADVIFYNGLHLEAAMGELLEEMSARRPTVAVTRTISRDSLLAPPEFRGAYDPHVWFDVEMWSRAVEAVRQALVELDPAGAAEFDANAARVTTELRELDGWVHARVNELDPARRVLVTAHDAFNYFGRAYGFEVRGLQGISTASEAGTADVHELAVMIAERRIPAVFVETSIPRRTIEAVQAAVRSRGFDVQIGGALFSDAMGNPGTDEGTYPGMVRHNVNTIVDGLGAGEGAVALRAPADVGPGQRWR